MGFFKQVAAALKPPSIAREREAARNPADGEAGEATLDALTPEQLAAYEANVAAVAERRAEAQAASDEVERKAAHREREDPGEATGEG